MYVCVCVCVCKEREIVCRRVCVCACVCKECVCVCDEHKLRLFSAWFTPKMAA